MAHSSPQTNATRQQIVVSKHDINHSLREEMSRLEITCFCKKKTASIKSDERGEGDKKNMQRETKSSTQHKNVLNSEKSFESLKKYRLSECTMCTFQSSTFVLQSQPSNKRMFNLSHNIHEILLRT